MVKPCRYQPFALPTWNCNENNTKQLLSLAEFEASVHWNDISVLVMV